jgi:hypothetical protein
MTSRGILHEHLESALSQERFGRYLRWAAGDRGRAIALYTLNTQISECLYTPLQIVEVALRNRIHATLAEAHHDGWFHEHDFLRGDRQPEQLAKALEDIEANRKEATPDRIVAELTFSFWTAMFGPDYETLWQTTLHRVGQQQDGKGLRRKDFSAPLAPIRIIRNRIAHHEPIIKWNLAKHHDKMIELVEWLSPAAAEWCREHDRFDKVYPDERIILVSEA